MWVLGLALIWHRDGGRVRDIFFHFVRSLFLRIYFMVAIFDIRFDFSVFIVFVVCFVILFVLIVIYFAAPTTTIQDKLADNVLWSHLRLLNRLRTRVPFSLFTLNYFKRLNATWKLSVAHKWWISAHCRRRMCWCVCVCWCETELILIFDNIVIFVVAFSQHQFNSNDAPEDCMKLNLNCTLFEIAHFEMDGGVLVNSRRWCAIRFWRNRR